MAATFVVEDGTGLATANSYSSVATADQYHENQGNPSAWSAANQATKEAALRQGTAYLDNAYGKRWTGFRVDSTQALDWPREFATNPALEFYDSDEVPTKLAHATAVAALLVVQGTVLIPTSQTEADVRSESKSMPGPFSKSVTYAGSKPAHATFPLVESMLVSSGLVTGGGGWEVASA